MGSRVRFSESSFQAYVLLNRLVQSALICGALTAAAVLSFPGISLADESGVSFWLPGIFGSLAAVPQQPGWSAALMYYRTSVSAGADVALARQFQIGNIPANLSANVNASLRGTGDLGIFIPNYAFATPVFGGQAALSLMTIYGNTSAAVSGTVTGTLNGMPFGPVFPNLSNSTTGVGDLYPQFTLRWNNGANNYMTYITGDIPVGDYSSTSLANNRHWAWRGRCRRWLHLFRSDNWT